MARIKEVTNCPLCNSTNLSDRWVAGYKLQQSCNNHWDDCEWVGKARTPTKRHIPKTKVVYVEGAGRYDIYDKNGYCTCNSGGTNGETLEESLIKELARMNVVGKHGPYTGVIWQKSVKVRAKHYT